MLKIYKDLKNPVMISKKNVKHETNSIKTQVDTMGARYPWLDFRYSGNKIIEISNFHIFPPKFFSRISKDDF